MGRSTSESTETTSVPAPSAAVSDREPSASRRSRARSTDAPDACRDNPVQANGSRTSPRLTPGSPARPAACKAASRRAGCNPNDPALAAVPSGSATSAKTSPSRCQAARRPRKAGPYPYPPAAIASYRPPTSTWTAPSGGHTVNVSARAGPGGTGGASRPRACRVHNSSGRVLGPGVHLDGPLATLTQAADHHLDPDRAVRGQHQRRLQGQLLDPAAAGRVPGPHRHLNERRPRQQHRPRHRVIGQPRLRPHRKPAGQQVPLTPGQLHRRAQQRMTAPRPGPAPPRPRRRGQGRLRPVPLPLERIGRQLHPPAPAQQPRPSPPPTPRTCARASARTTALTARPAPGRSTGMNAAPLRPRAARPGPAPTASRPGRSRGTP